jgi:hypothetical protein
MKSINILKNLNVFKDLRSFSENERESPIHFTSRDPNREFSFSPEKTQEPSGGLADLLLKSLKKKPLDPEAKSSKSKSPVQPPKKANPSPNETFKPSLNPKSLKLAKQAEKEGKSFHSKKRDPFPQPQPDENKTERPKVSIKEFLERNYIKELVKLEGKKSSTPVPPLDKVDSQCTFKPTTDLKSREMAYTHRVDLYELAVRREEEKKSERMKLLRKKEMEEMKQCTFTPKINKKVGFSSRIDDSRLTPDRGCYSRKYCRNLSPFS